MQIINLISYFFRDIKTEIMKITGRLPVYQRSYQAGCKKIIFLQIQGVSLEQGEEIQTTALVLIYVFYI